MALYSLKGDIPAPIPNRIRLSNGWTKTDSSTFTDEDIADAGYVLVNNPPLATWPNRIVWDSETKNWIEVPPSDAEINELRIKIVTELNDALNEINMIILDKLENGINAEPCETEYRTNLLAILENVDDTFDPYTVEIPMLVYPGPVVLPEDDPALNE